MVDTGSLHDWPGGTSILGGEGAVWRTVVGVLFIALIGNGYDLLGLDPL